MKSLTPGDVLTLSVSRGGETVEVGVTVGEKQVSASQDNSSSDDRQQYGYGGFGGYGSGSEGYGFSFPFDSFGDGNYNRG